MNTESKTKTIARISEKNSWGDKAINSRAVVFEAFEYLNLPRPSIEGLTCVINSSNSAQFKSAIEEALQLNGQSASQETKRYLTGLALCISENMSSLINDLGYKNLPLGALIHIGSTNGIAFRNAVNSGITHKDPNFELSIGFIDDMIQDALIQIGAPPMRAQRAPFTLPSPAHSEKISSTPKVVESSTFLSAHVYGSKAALCFNAVSQNNKHVVIIDAAPMKEITNSDGHKSVDWKSSIKIQLGHKELPLVYGVLVGWSNSIKLDSHGAHHDKAFEIERQEGKFFIKVLTKGKPPCALPMTGTDALGVSLLILAQIIKQAPSELQNHPNIIIDMMRQIQQIKPLK